jgi:hypothetical protein
LLDGITINVTVTRVVGIRQGTEIKIFFVATKPTTPVKHRLMGANNRIKPAAHRLAAASSWTDSNCGDDVDGNFQIWFDRAMLTAVLGKAPVHGLVHGQSYNHSRPP